MPWNWELPNWPNFIYDPLQVSYQEKQFLLGVGSSFAFLKNTSDQEYNQFVVEILSMEGLESSKIEGEILDRESLQSSIRKHFGLSSKVNKEKDKESRMAELLCNVYETFDKPLNHKMLLHWHGKLFNNSTHVIDSGKYRTHNEPVQIVSNRHNEKRVFFEAPPSTIVHEEMKAFIRWFNLTRKSESILVRAAIAHVYFESIHPFEDGNGRVGRLLVEKILSQGVERPILIAVSKVLEKRKKEYYAALERCNRTLKIDHWIDFFADSILQAQKESMDLLNFLINKTKIMASLSGQLNGRQEKVLIRMFAEGVTGFKGGLSSEKYIAITKTSRATATRDLSDLVEKGILFKTGELKHTRYWLKY